MPILADHLVLGPVAEIHGVARNVAAVVRHHDAAVPRLQAEVGWLRDQRQGDLARPGRFVDRQPYVVWVGIL